MSKFLSIIIIISFALILYPEKIKAAYYSADLKEAINIECKKSVKEKKYSTKNECVKSLKGALEAQGIVSVNQVPNIEDREYIADICVFDIKLGALKYNECLYKAVNDKLGIEVVEPPVLVKNQEESGNDEDEEAPPVQIPMPENVINDVYNKVRETTFYVVLWEWSEEENDWMGSGTGSAVHIGDGMLVTNCHVATRFCGFYYDKDSTEFEICDSVKTAIDVISVNENVADFSNPKWFRDLEIIKEEQKSDRCIISTDDPNFNYPSAELKYFDDLKIHDTVYAIGNPRGFIGKPTEGKITMLYNEIPPGIHDMTGYRLLDYRLKYIETDAPVDKGNSGGGLFSSDGKLIGVPSLCKTMGGPQECSLIDGEEQCQYYCNLSAPQNFAIPIDMFLDIM